MTAFRVYAPDELGKDGYPLAWHETIKHQVRDAAGHRCVRCGHPYPRGSGEWSPCDERCMHGGPVRYSRNRELNGWYYTNLGKGITAGAVAAVWEEVEAQYRILTVHHLTGCWGREAEAKRDCRWWNLVAVCQRCHLALQRKVDMHRVYPWEHSEWFKPYVAGYYAWTYLGEDLDREATEARLDELLGLELAA